MSSSFQSKLDMHNLSTLFPSTSSYTLNYGWAALAAGVLLSMGQEDLIADLANAVLEQTGEDVMAQCSAMRKVREACLKASALVGFPRVSTCAEGDVNFVVVYPECRRHAGSDLSSLPKFLQKVFCGTKSCFGVVANIAPGHGLSRISTALSQGVY